MGKHKKKFTEHQLQRRVYIENELSQIKPICPMARKLASLDGFIEYFYNMMELYDTYKEAYVRLEEFHEQIFGKRKYSEYNSFRVMATRWIVQRRSRGETFARELNKI